MTTIRLGDVTVSSVVEIGRSSFPTASMLPDSTPEAIAAHHSWLKPHFFDEAVGDLGSRIQTFVVRTPRHTVLIDTCVGNDKNREGSALWHMRAGTYLDDLEAAGVTPAEVDYVVCTHLHVDHVGWNTRLVEGRWVPTFPRAKYVFAGEDAWLRFEPSPGHTPGHVCVRLSTGAGEAVFTGDLMHRVVQVAEPQWSSRFCHDPKRAAETRREFVERHADSGVLVLAAHFPRPGHIVREGGGTRFVAAA